MHELIKYGIVTKFNYRNWVNRGKVEVARTAGGKGNYALIVIDSLPKEAQARLKCVCPHYKESHLAAWVRENYRVDAKARDYFFDPSACGVELTVAKANEYVTNASTLNTCIGLYGNGKACAQAFPGGKYDWGDMAATIDILRQEYGHTLPASTLGFRRRVNEYRRGGYASLISGKYGNQSARKVDHRTERLILSLASRLNKPDNRDVLRMYNSFVTGELEVYDLTTGALFDPYDFTGRDGEPKELSEGTVGRYINMPRNRVLIEAATESRTTFMHGSAPHMHRDKPRYSLSKVSMDDRDLPRKLKDTRQRPKAYYAYDVASDCCIGFAYNRKKNADLVVDMFRNMFRLLERHGWGCPAEVEVENHLMSQWRDSFLKAGVMFPFVRFCAPMNSQEKHAENNNGVKKRTIEHRNHVGIGRFYAKRRQYRTESVKVFDEMNDTYIDKEYYSWEELIADDMRDIMEYNNAPHHDQKRYPGMSRWEVLVANINPDLRPLDKVTMARYIGERVSTSIRRNSYCRVNGEAWWLSDTSVLERLAPNDYKVDAYYIPEEDGSVKEVYIFQNDMLVDRLEDPGRFNTATAEQTDKDREAFTAQRKKINGFYSYIKERAVSPVGVIAPERAALPEPEAVPVAAVDDDDGWWDEPYRPAVDSGMRGTMSV